MAAIQSRLTYAKTLMAAESAGGTFLTINGIITADAVRGNLWKDPALK
jgi:hypothetical protein